MYRVPFAAKFKRTIVAESADDRAGVGDAWARSTESPPRKAW